ncbi:hypothetical protein Tco_0942479, partial [Tanacetum coccineum]
THRDTHPRVEEDVHALDIGEDAPVSHVTELKDTDFGVDGTQHEEDDYIGSDRGDKDLADGYYMPYPYDEGSNPKGCKTDVERFPTPAEIRRIKTLSQEELIGRSKYQEAHEKLRSRDKKHRKFKAERAAKEAIAAEKAKVNKELVKAKSQLKSQETILKDLKYQLSQLESDTHLHNDIIASLEKQAKESRSDVTPFFQSDFESLVHTQFQELSHRVSNFVPNAQEKFDNVVAAFPTKTFPFFGKVFQSAESSLRDIAQLKPDPTVPFSKASYATVSSGVWTHDRSSAPSVGTFGHTSTP